MLFDTHAHYDDEQFDTDRREVLSSLPEHNVSLVLNPASNIDSARKIMSYLDEFPFLYAAVGTHPHDAARMTDDDLSEFEKMSEHPKVVAIGEIGLDYYYDNSPRPEQKKRLRDQLALAQNLGLPAILHDRDAHEDTLNILRQFPRVRGVVHCYSGSAEMAKRLTDMGWWLSFTGVVTYKNARRSIETVLSMPRDMLMIETDSPYLSPLPHRGKRNSSHNLHIVAEKLAEVLKMPADEFAELTMSNSRRFFGIKTP
ncbi:MAG: TatD family hydrolase [Oscillospiraceae bacterium]|jgi:TatD DNase family protein